jgi:hypothetical protein
MILCDHDFLICHPQCFIALLDSLFIVKRINASYLELEYIISAGPKKLVWRGRYSLFKGYAFSGPDGVR